MRSTKILLALLLCAVAGSCGQDAPEQAAAPATDQPAWLLASAPSDAQGVSEVKSTGKEGDKVVLRGRIGGRTDPMSADTALFVIMDTAVPSCAEMEGDTCATPWDYCCETPESLAANNATVQLVGSDGSTIKLDLAKYGFAPLDEVIVVGTVGPRPSEQALMIRATALHRVGS